MRGLGVVERIGIRRLIRLEHGMESGHGDVIGCSDILTLGRTDYYEIAIGGMPAAKYGGFTGSAAPETFAHLSRFLYSRILNLERRLMNQQLLRLGHSPDPDDAFMFYALAQNPPLIPTGKYRFEHILQDIQTLNQRAMNGELEITAISNPSEGTLPLARP